MLNIINLNYYSFSKFWLMIGTSDIWKQCSEIRPGSSKGSHCKNSHFKVISFTKPRWIFIRDFQTKLFGLKPIFNRIIQVLKPNSNRIIRFKPNSKSINKPSNRIIRELFVEPNYSDPNYSESELFGLNYSDAFIRIVTTEF